jgi:hypothetical protein
MALDASYAHHDDTDARHGICRIHPGRNGLIPSGTPTEEREESATPPECHPSGLSSRARLSLGDLYEAERCCVGAQFVIVYLRDQLAAGTIG